MAKRYMKKQAMSGRSLWQSPNFRAVTSAAVAACFVAVFFIMKQRTDRIEQEDFAIATMDFEMLENMGLLMELEILEEIDMLEKWEG